MAALDVESAPPAQPVAVVMGRRDETVPYDLVAATWRRWEASGRLAPGSRLVTIPDGDHGLLGHVDAIADEVRRLL
jgi:pimeloyl-ACP methyl ester carboxylesterase